MNAIKAIHAADVAPVAHGRWEWFDEETGTPFTGYEREWGWKCSYCGEELPDDYDDPDNRPTFRFCHSCGAKMDIEAHRYFTAKAEAHGYKLRENFKF